MTSTNRIAFYVLAALLVAGALAIVPGTRSWTDVKITIVHAAALVAPALIILTVAVRGGARLPAGFGRFALVAAGYLAFVALSYLWASHGWIVKYVFFQRLFMMLLAVSAAYLAADASRWKTLAVIYAATAAFAAMVALVWHSATRTLNDVRLPMGNANLLAAFLLIGMAFAAAFLLREWKGRARGEMLAGAGAALSVMFVTFAFCRPVSYAMGLAVFAVIFAALSSRRPWTIIALGALVGLAGFCVAWKAGYVNRFMHTKNYIVRTELWRRAWLMAQARPVLGWGAGNYLTDSQPYTALTLLREVEYMEGGADKTEPLWRAMPAADSRAHNEYLHQAAEGGIVGLLIYLALVGTALWAGLSARRKFEERALLDGAIALFAALLFTDAMNPEVLFSEFGAHFWTIAGMLVAARGATAVREVRVNRGGAVIAALVVTAGAGVGIWQFVVRDYLAARDFVAAEGRSINADRSEEQARRLASQDQAQEAARWYDEASRWRVAGAARYDACAGGTWDQVLRIRALYAAASDYYAARMPAEAERDWGILSREMVAFADTEYWLGRIAEMRGDYAAAVAHYRLDYRMHPQDAFALERIAAIEAREAVEPPLLRPMPPRASESTGRNSQARSPGGGFAS